MRVAQNWGDNFLPPPLPSPANQQGFTDITGRAIAVSETHTLSPNKINEFRFGFVYTRSYQDVLGPRLFDEYGIKGAVNTQNQRTAAVLAQRVCRARYGGPGEYADTGIRQRQFSSR